MQFPDTMKVALENGQSFKVSGIKPSKDSCFMVHPCIQESRRGEPVVMESEITFSHIPTGLTLRKLIPTNIVFINQMLHFVEWLETCSKAELTILSRLGFSPQKLDHNAIAALQSMRMLAKQYRRAN